MKEKEELEKEYSKLYSNHKKLQMETNHFEEAIQGLTEKVV